MGKVVHKIRCPNPNHEDTKPSCCVYEDGGKHCFVCGFHERGENEDESYKNRTGIYGRSGGTSSMGSGSILVPYGLGYESSVSPTLVDTYHRWLLENEVAQSWLRERGISDGVLRAQNLGHTGSLYTIPIPEVQGVWNTFLPFGRACGSVGESQRGYANIRFRTDDNYYEDKRYFGLPGRNQPQLYACGATLRQERNRESKWRSNPQRDEVSERDRPRNPYESYLPERLVVTEGEYDTLTASSHGYDSVTMTGGAASMTRHFIPSLVALGWSGRLVLCGDSDEVGLACQKALATQAKACGIRVSATRNKYKDLGECYQAEGEKGVKDVIDNASPLFSDRDINNFYK